MKTDNLFEEIKIKMVMKLRGLPREAAVKELRGSCGRSMDIGRCESDELMSAEDFFGED